MAFISAEHFIAYKAAKTFVKVHTLIISDSYKELDDYGLSKIVFDRYFLTECCKMLVKSYSIKCIFTLFNEPEQIKFDKNDFIKMKIVNKDMELTELGEMLKKEFNKLLSSPFQ